MYIQKTYKIVKQRCDATHTRNDGLDDTYAYLTEMSEECHVQLRRILMPRPLIIFFVNFTISFI